MRSNAAKTPSLIELREATAPVRNAIDACRTRRMEQNEATKRFVAGEFQFKIYISGEERWPLLCLQEDR